MVAMADPAAGVRGFLCHIVKEIMPSATSVSHIQPDALLRLPAVLTRVPVSRATWWQGVKEGRYPAAIKLGPKTTCWRSSDIDKLIAELAMAGTTKTAKATK